MTTTTTIDIDSLAQSMGSYGMPTDLIDQVRELGRDRKRMDVLAEKARLVKYDSGWQASFDVSVNGMAEKGYHTDLRAAVDAAS